MYVRFLWNHWKKLKDWIEKQNNSKKNWHRFFFHLFQIHKCKVFYLSRCRFNNLIHWSTSTQTNLIDFFWVKNQIFRKSHVTTDKIKNKCISDSNSPVVCLFVHTSRYGNRAELHYLSDITHGKTAFKYATGGLAPVAFSMLRMCNVRLCVWDFFLAQFTILLIRTFETKWSYQRIVIRLYIRWLQLRVYSIQAHIHRHADAIHYSSFSNRRFFTSRAISLRKQVRYCR